MDSPSMKIENKPTFGANSPPSLFLFFLDPNPAPRQLLRQPLPRLPSSISGTAITTTCDHHLTAAIPSPQIHPHQSSPRRSSSPAHHPLRRRQPRSPPATSPPLPPSLLSAAATSNQQPYPLLFSAAARRRPRCCRPAAPLSASPPTRCHRQAVDRQQSPVHCSARRRAVRPTVMQFVQSSCSSSSRRAASCSRSVPFHPVVDRFSPTTRRIAAEPCRFVRR